LRQRSRLSEHYLALARDLDVLEPKVPEDVYKSHLVRRRLDGGGWPVGDPWLLQVEGT
jgi:hypothetical protein